MMLTASSMKNVPNTLTILRIVVTPVILWLLVQPSLWAKLTAFVLFVLAAISDWLDGKLARSLEVRSRLGQFLDPFADKVLVLGTFVVLAFIRPELVPWWAVALIALRDLVVTGLRTWAEARGRSIRTSRSAKLKTAFQLTFLILTLLLLALARVPGQVGAGAEWVLQSVFLFGLLVAVVVVTAITGIIYFMNIEYTTPVETDA